MPRTQSSLDVLTAAGLCGGDGSGGTGSGTGSGSSSGTGSGTGSGSSSGEQPPVGGSGCGDPSLAPVYATAPTDLNKTYYSVFTYGRDVQFGGWTYKLLEKAGLLEFVYLFLQTDDDEITYRQLYPDLKVVRSPLGLHQTANYAYNSFWADGTKVLQLHDDVKQVTRFVWKDNGDGTQKAVREPVEDLGALAEELFSHMETHGARLGGIYINNNAGRGLGNRDEVSIKNAFIVDPVVAVIVRTGTVVLTEKHKQKQDAERTVLCFKLDGVVVRMNHYGMDVQDHDSPSATGGFGFRTQEQDQQATRDFLEDYGAYVEQTRVHTNGISGFQFRPNAPALHHTATKALQQYERRLLEWQQKRSSTSAAATAAATATATATAAPVPVPVPAPPPLHLHRFDIRKPLRFSAAEYPHQTGAFAGWRAFFSAFNYDHNYKGQLFCAHSAALLDQPPQPPQYLDVDMGGVKYDALVRLLKGKYRSMPLTGQKPPASKYGTGIHGASFGLGKSRESQEEQEANGLFTKQVQAKGNTTYPDLYKASKDALAESLGDDFFGTTSKHRYRSLFFSLNARSLKHIDPNNLGDSVVFAIGDYTGGELEVYGEGEHDTVGGMWARNNGVWELQPPGGGSGGGTGSGGSSGTGSGGSSGAGSGSSSSGGGGGEDELGSGDEVEWVETKAGGDEFDGEGYVAKVKEEVDMRLFGSDSDGDEEQQPSVGGSGGSSGEWCKYVNAKINTSVSVSLFSFSFLFRLL